MPKDERQPGPGRRIARAALAGSKASLGTVWLLLRLVVPVSLAMALLERSGLLALLAARLGPAMGLLGLPGEGALVLISAALLNLYSAVAVAASLALDLREATILAVMCLTAHNLIVETAVMRKTGSSALKMVALRLGLALGAALLYDLLLPASLAGRPFLASGGAPGPAAGEGLAAFLGAWALSAGRLSLKIALLVLAVLVGQRLLDEFKVTDFLARAFAPLMRFLGLPARASFLWIVVNVAGYAYGAAIVIEEIKSGRMRPQEGDLFNHHAGVCHSLLEDTALFAAVGLPLFWLTLPRLALAGAVVWAERVRRHYFRRSFRAGVA